MISAVNGATGGALSGLISTVLGQSIGGGTIASKITLNPLNTGIGVYAVNTDSVSQPLNGSNTIDVSQDGNDNINFKLQDSWLNALNISFQSS